MLDLCGHAVRLFSEASCTSALGEAQFQGIISYRAPLQLEYLTSSTSSLWQEDLALVSNVHK